MADWQEAVQASVIALIFAFMVAKLVSVVMSFRGENLRVERGSIEGALLSEASEAEELLGEESDSSSSDHEANLPEIEQSEDFAAPVGEGKKQEITLKDLGAEELGLSDVEALEHKNSLRSGESVVHSFVEEQFVQEKEPLREDKGSGTSFVQPEAFVKEKEFKGTDHIVEKEVVRPEVTDRPRNEEEGKAERNSGALAELSDLDDWEGVESSELEELFGAAATFVATQAVGPGLKVSNEDQLLLYGLYKCATEGPCRTAQPPAYRMSARAKWNAWQNLGDIGPEEAMNRYIALVSKMSPDWNNALPKGEDQGQSTSDAGDAVQRGGMGGPVFSSLMMNEEGGEEQGILEPIHVCAREGDLAGLTQQVENGTAVNLQDSDGRTALHWAADRGHLSAIELLIKKGAEIHSKDVEGQTALHYAVTCEQEEIAKYLISAGANPATPDNDGVTPLNSRPPHWTWMRSIS
ncbi:hypothetical protein R1flu_011940 [Riccia fluitans]|uniref:ACB domain-containing protein n=1 Tax=Riccia fluitans TaxID=41844 RepID=A0ABD1Z972_9MARC